MLGIYCYNKVPMTPPKPTVLYVITKSNFGGAQKYVYDLAGEAKSQEYTVHVACGNTGETGSELGLLVEKLQQKNIPVHVIKNFQRDMSPLQDLKAFWEVAACIWRLKPGTLHLTSSKAGGIGTLAGRLLRVPNIIFTSHGLTMDESWRPWWQQKLIAGATWTTLILSHHAIMINTQTADRARRRFGLKNKVHLIFNGISDFTVKQNQTSQQELGLSISPKNKIIGGIGELHLNKQWASVIEIMPSLPPEVHLVIIGHDGGEQPALEKLISRLQLSDRVHLTGYAKDAQEHLGIFDIFILPSAKEGLPFVLLEAGLAGVPVIASDLPGNRDIITSGQDGLLIDPHSTSFGMAITMVLRDQSIQKQFTSQLREKLLTKFSPQKMFRDTFALYR